MLDYIFTALAPILLGCVALYGSKSVTDQNEFMSKQYTTMLKAVCCIIVILVHIPLVKQNKLQDGIGSFAYICVTLFFLISAYGMKLSITKKQDYLKHFWRNRLAALLIPQILVNIFGILLTFRIKSIEWFSIFNLNSYVVVLLSYCLWFYIVYLGRSFYSKKTIDSLLMAGIIISSIFSYFMMEKTYWCYERFGLLWGLILFLNIDKIKTIVNPTAKRTTIYLIICLIFGVAYLKFKYVFFWGEYLLKIILGLSIILFVFSLSSKRVFGNRVLNYLGNISYEVYLSHGIIMSFLMHYFPNLSSGIFILFTITMTIIFSSVVHSLGKPIVKLVRSK